ncbi:hypothetical protein KR51_00011910 [Rubidibacter lacunae KORDI 51-2]|uniref:Uncharacterized protein n=1 Tax=Rubidibacter lacunae KORDI 51-2 TaxID=582515 RepID=U5DC61_9CHRO|nr:hypothetical protein [Rubidibacter lacunae]ERN42103.1 hypothetical protein KR51_00011910 [Rubidibacter lacunae KORDI 51-2]
MPLLISLVLAVAATLLSLSVQEEIVRVAAVAVAAICGVLSLLLAPLALKVVLVLAPFIGPKLFQ